MTRIDRSDPAWPREVDDDHIAADADHAAVPTSADNCAVCGLATTSDGKRHGFDA